jgi:hypothetical protein
MTRYPTRAQLPLPFHEQRGADGVLAEFDAEGALRRLSTWEGGTPSGCELTIDHDTGAIVLAVREQLLPTDFSGGDDDDDPAAPFRAAVDVAVARLWDRVDRGRLVRCAFCEKRSHEVRRLIAGPTSYICDECVALCAEIVATT